MTSDDPVLSLDLEDQLSLGIGRVARIHARLDSVLRFVHQQLIGPGFGVYLTSGITSTNRLLDDCRLMLDKASTSFDPEVTAAAMSALDAAGAANTLRNRVVHDMWMREIDATDEPPQWDIYRHAAKQLNPVSTEPRDLAFVTASATTVIRAVHRVGGVSWALMELLPPNLGGPSHRTMWLAQMRDQFTLLDDGGLRFPTPKS